MDAGLLTLCNFAKWPTILFQIIPKPFASAGVPQLLQGFGFDLSNALPRYSEVAAHFFQSSGTAVFQPEAHYEYVPLARSEGVQRLFYLFPQNLGARRL